MKAFIYKNYGSPEVLKFHDIEKPTAKDNEILVNIQATTVTAGDVRLRSSDFPRVIWLLARLIFGLFSPKKQILGHEFSGIVEAKGKNVTKFKIGQAVFGTTSKLKQGAYAEYIAVSQDGIIALKPENMNFQEATSLPVGAMTALFLWKKANIQTAKKVLVYGASGSVGTYTLQIAKSFGASVTAVCSTTNVAMVKSLGADEVIDYKKEDYTSLSKDFDIVFDAVGKTSKSEAKKVLKATGVFMTIQMLTKETTENLLAVKDLAEKGKLKAFIDKTYPFEKIVEAHKYVDTGRKRGNVVIDLKNQE